MLVASYAAVAQSKSGGQDFSEAESTKDKLFELQQLFQQEVALQEQDRVLQSLPLNHKIRWLWTEEPVLQLSMRQAHRREITDQGKLLSFCCEDCSQHACPSISVQTSFQPMLQSSPNRKDCEIISALGEISKEVEQRKGFRSSIDQTVGKAELCY